MSKAHELYDAAFSSVIRDPRSDEYKRGVLESLVYKLGESSLPPLPYPAGSAQLDAYFSGWDEGKSLAANYRNTKPILPFPYPHNEM